MGSLGVQRVGQVAAPLPDGTVLVAGGRRSISQIFSSAERFIPNICGPESDLAVTVVDNPDPVVVLGTLVYQIDVTNDGPDDAIDVFVDKVLPSGHGL